ncbi:MAG: hypothetical protein JWM80_5272 [Cyanobacteria bacterium RYN_339]|nr:hypothetical protein [Cyanobacteria bacterium RYN_339]
MSRIAVPLFAALVVVALSAGPGTAGALDQLLAASPFPTATPAPDAEPTATPTPRGAFFTSLYLDLSGDGEFATKVGLDVAGTTSDGHPVTFIWVANQGVFNQAKGSEVIWTAPAKGPLVVPLSVTVTDGRQTATGIVTVTVDAKGEASVTKVDLPGLQGPPGAFMGCFGAGTPVRLADGTSRPIEQIKVGDRVAAYDLDAHKPADALVEQLIVHQEASRLTLVQTADGHVLRATANHPLMTPGEVWKHVSDLVPGDMIIVRGGQGYQPVRIAAIVRDESAAGVIYNLKTTRHDYVAADVLVHNKCLAAGSRVDAPGGTIAVDALRPGDVVLDAAGRPTRVTHVYRKTTEAPSLPGKQLAPGLAVTANHLVMQGGAYRPAGEGSWPDVAIMGAVYDLQTEAGSYRAAGHPMASASASSRRRSPSRLGTPMEPSRLPR